MNAKQQGPFQLMAMQEIRKDVVLARLLHRAYKVHRGPVFGRGKRIGPFDFAAWLDGRPESRLVIRRDLHDPSMDDLRDASEGEAAPQDPEQEPAPSSRPSPPGSAASSSPRGAVIIEEEYYYRRVVRRSF